MCASKVDMYRNLRGVLVSCAALALASSACIVGQLAPLMPFSSPKCHMHALGTSKTTNADESETLSAPLQSLVERACSDRVLATLRSLRMKTAAARTIGAHRNEGATLSTEWDQQQRKHLRSISSVLGWEVDMVPAN